MIYIEPNSEKWLSLNDLPNERWKDINNYKGLYQISDYGRVKSLNYNHANTPKILKIKVSKQGYAYIALYNKNKNKYFRLHKLVAEIFMPDKTTFKSMLCENRNEVNLDRLEINHKDENKLNNHVNNLEWCTAKYNCNYGNRNSKTAKKQSIPINQYTLKGEYIKTWSSAQEIERKLGFNDSHICAACLGKRKSANGYLWRKYNNNIKNIEPYKPKMLNQFTRKLVKDDLDI